MEKKCSECRHVLDVKGEFMCRRYPPVVVEYNHHPNSCLSKYGSFPYVVAGWCCGEWEDSRVSKMGVLNNKKCAKMWCNDDAEKNSNYCKEHQK
jgi:hypothetical protein